MISLKKIYVDQSVIHEDLTKRVLERSSEIPYELIEVNQLEVLSSQISLTEGKRILVLSQQRGDLVKPCPGTLPPYLCCRYTVINHVIQCPLDCTYCILQSYLDRPFMILHTNLSGIFRNVERVLRNQPGRFFRFGTGELTDSLALDDITRLTVDYVRFFNNKRNALIEFKTKTASIEQILDLPPENVVVSWSMNPQWIVQNEEFCTDSVIKRLQAALRCQEKGFLLGLHFDPILFVPNWEPLYHELVEQIFSYVDGSRIVWISLGSLRYPPSLKEIIQSRFSQCGIVYEEMIRGMDGKMRYPKPLRIEMYQHVYSWLKHKWNDLFIYFCMESPDVWDRVMGVHPESNEELDFWFAQSLWKRFPELNMDEPQRKSYFP